MTISTACLNESTSNSPSRVLNFIRFNDARLQAESSRNMYSEHGFEALIRAVFFEVCHLFTVLSYCMPGSPHCQVASAILRRMSRALKVFTTLPSFTARVENSL